MDIYKNYKPSPIPNREQLEKNNELRAELMKNENFVKSNNEVFAEIELNQLNMNTSSSQVLPSQSISSEIDEKRAMFYSMRKIARDDPYYDANNSNVFYHQAMLMQNFEDDFDSFEPFSSYYPYYQKMGFLQLRTYFTWRTQVRKGNIAYTSTSYVFLYIYELLNNVGVSSPEDGLDKLMSFWNTYRTYDDVLDNYILQWIKDYHIYYPLKRSFGEFADEYNIKMHYPTIFGYESGQCDSFNIFACISKYNIKKSIFFNEETEKIFQNCFYLILNKLRELFAQKNQCFEDMVFYTLSKASLWMPFSKALFYPALKQQNRQVIISKREIYNCVFNQWMCKTVILSERGKQLIGYIMKEMESSLRKVLNFKYKITADLSMCDKETLKTFKSIGISLPQFIKDCVLEFYNLSTRKIIKVNIGNIDQIRHEALATQEKLIVPETAGIEEIKHSQSLEKINIDTQKTADFHHEIHSSKVEISEYSISNIWENFLASLSHIELNTIKLALNDKNLKEFALENKIMLEVLADGINQKSMDCIGDTLLEIDGDTAYIYEDYKLKLIGMVEY